MGDLAGVRIICYDIEQIYAIENMVKKSKAWSSLERLVVYKKTKPVSDELKADIRNFFKWSRKMDKMVHKILRENCERELI